MFCVVITAMPFVKCSENYIHAFQTLSSGGGAVSWSISFFTGCIKESLLACKWILPSLLLRSEPYFKSPLIAHPMAASCALIWWCLPVFRSISNKNNDLNSWWPYSLEWLFCFRGLHFYDRRIYLFCISLNQWIKVSVSFSGILLTTAQ